MSERRPPSLSEDERRRLRVIEADLAHEDPAFAATFRRAAGNAAPSAGRILAAAAIVGVVGIIGGLIVAEPIIGGAGFVTLVTALDRLVVWHDLAGRIRDGVARNGNESTGSDR